jgi:hypothetical protein
MSTIEIPCPFVYANGKKCPGHITRVEAYKADVTWTPDADGKWKPRVGEPRSHYHLFCSEKGNHAGTRGQDRLKCYLSALPMRLDESPSRHNAATARVLK